MSSWSITVHSKNDNIVLVSIVRKIARSRWSVQADDMELFRGELRVGCLALYMDTSAWMKRYDSLRGK